MTDALELVKKSIDQDPLAAPAHNMLGAIHASMDHRHEARIAFQTALGLDRPRRGRGSRRPTQGGFHDARDFGLD
jgi:hypothetical protein